MVFNNFASKILSKIDTAKYSIKSHEKAFENIYFLLTETRILLYNISVKKMLAISVLKYPKEDPGEFYG